MKRSFLFAVLAVLVSAMLLGPLPSPLASAQEQITLDFMGWGSPSEQKIFQTVFDSFQKDFPNIKVNYINVPPGEYLQKLNTVAVAGDMPDVFYMADGWFGSWVSRDLLLPIEDRIDAAELKNIWPAALDRYRYDGKVVGQGALYCLPKDLGPFVMVYNKDLFDKYGVAYPATDGSWTWDVALENYKKLTEFAADGSIVSIGVGNIPLEALVWSNGADFLNEDRTAVTIDDPLFTEALQWSADLANVHHVAPTQQDTASQSAYDLWIAGKVATFVMGPWDQPAFWELGFNWDIGVFPASPRTKTPAMWTGSMGYAVSAATKHQQAAIDLARYLSVSEVGQRMFYELGQQVPNRIDMAQGEFLKWEKPPATRQIFLDNIAKWGHPLPSTYVSNNLWLDTMWQEMAPVWTGERKAEEWAKEWAGKLTELLNQEDQIRSVRFGNPLPKASQ
jgi:multiple sugar transport system substrate-binding protein